MRLALVTTPPSVCSGIGDYTRRLLPHLREHCEVTIFVEPGLEGEGYAGLECRSIETLMPREHDQLLYQLGNERSHGFMARRIRALGGTVVLHDWVLFDMSLAAWPALARGGAKGHALALREGGLGEARVYLSNWLDRRRARRRPERPNAGEAGAGSILAGWHAPEPQGRWTGDRALFRVAGSGCRAVRVELATEAGREVRLDVVDGGSGCRAGPGSREHRLELELDGRDEALLALETTGIEVSRQQREHGDTRRLGSFVRRIEFDDERGTRALDLSAPAALPIATVDLTRDRFRLALNRSAVRFGDAFVVHSELLKRRILESRNARTAIAVVNHGADAQWREDDRRAGRPSAGLPESWREAFLVTSFGALQVHKRLDVLLDALALARRTHPSIHLALIGRHDAGEFDALGEARRRGVEQALHLAGHVDERHGWDLIHAGDLAVQLRGPSTGGTSGGVFQSLSLGRGVIASELDEQRELPAACVIGVPSGEQEVQALARHLTELADDSPRRAAMERAARAFVETECAWPLVARRYVEALEAFPGPRSAARSLIAMRLGKAAREGYRRGAGAPGT